MFNNIDPKTNGEEQFFHLIKNHIHCIFDVGCRSDSEFVNFEGEVHYFEPVSNFIENLKTQPNQNKVSYFNNFGLGDKNSETYYYPKYQSFIDRVISCHYSDSSNKYLLRIKKACDYIVENNIETIDFLKIDTEGYELLVLKGFEDHLQKVKILQFEYGGTFMDNSTTLIDVINYLSQHEFYKFSYLTKDGPVSIKDFADHYQYCNIVCINRKSDYIPF
jgi:FkbM family methyltransferase